MLDRPIIIWGCGNDGRKLYRLLQNQKIKAAAFCDSNRDLINSLYNDTPVISCEEAMEKGGINLALAFHQWMSVKDTIKVKKDTEIFADYLYEEIEPGNRCILCGSQECTGSRAHFAPFLVERMFNDKNIQTKLIHCKKCNFWFSRYRPNDLEMEKLYAGYRGEEYVRQRKKYEPGYSAEFYESADYMVKRKQELGVFFRKWIECDLIHTLLDYGGDEGQYIPDPFCNAEKYVFEISGKKVRDGIILLNDLEEVKRKRFDLVMCCQVLEHVSDPIEVIENMTGVLKKGGYLYIEVPNSNVFMAYFDVEIHEHINFFFRETMLFIASKMGFRVRTIEADYSYKTLLVKE